MPADKRLMEKLNCRRAVGIVLLSLLAGCAQLNHDLKKSEQDDASAEQSEKVSEVSIDPRADNIINFVISAEVGETRTIKDTQEGESKFITVGSFYHAASGRMCRRFTKETKKSNVKRSVCNSLVVCRNQTGDWYQVRQIVNVEHPKKSDLRCAYKTKQSINNIE